jgi:hypothetical protein
MFSKYINSFLDIKLNLVVWERTLSYNNACRGNSLSHYRSSPRYISPIEQLLHERGQWTLIFDRHYYPDAIEKNIRWAERIACTGKMKNMYRIRLESTNRRDMVGDIVAGGSIILKLTLKENWGSEWTRFVILDPKISGKVAKCCEH